MKKARRRRYRRKSDGSVKSGRRYDNDGHNDMISFKSYSIKKTIPVSRYKIVGKQPLRTSR